MRLLLRLWNVMSGTATNLVLFFEKRNPEALLQHERERFRGVVGEFNKGLVIHATLIERLKSAIVEHERQVSHETAKIDALLRSGDRQLAGRNAVELQNLRTCLARDREKLQSAEEKYQSLVASRDEAVSETRRRMEQLRQQIGNLKVNRAVADLEGMAAAMVGSINDPGDDLNRLAEMLGEENEKARARVRVASGGTAAGTSADEKAERDAIAAQALAEYLAAQSDAETLALPDYTFAPAINPTPRQR